MKRLFLAIGLMIAAIAQSAPARAASHVLTWGLDTALSPATVCLYYTSANCFTIGTMSAGGVFAQNNIISTEFPGLTSNNQSTGFPGMDGVIVAPGAVNFFMSNTVAVTATNATASTLRIDRGTTGTGGSNGLNPAGLLVNLAPSANDAFFEYGISSVLLNKSLATTGSQNVALAGSAFKQGASAVGPTWAIFGQVVDQTGVANPAAGTIGAEIDAGTGVANGGTDNNKQRLILQLVETGASGTHIAYGILMGPNTTGAIIDVGWSLKGAAASTYGIGIDFTGANTFSTSAILLSGAFQQPVSWANAVGTFTGGTAGSTLFKGNDNVSYFDNYDSGAFTFRGNGSVTVASLSTASGVKSSLFTATNLVESSTAPTISAGFCTTPSVVANNGTWAFTINVGSACAASTGTIGLPTATTGWVCTVHDVTTPASNVVEQTGGTTNTAILQNYVRTTGVAGNFTSSDVLRVHCAGY